MRICIADGYRRLYDFWHFVITLDQEIGIGESEAIKTGMNIYLAGGYTGNLNPFWNKIVKDLQSQGKRIVDPNVVKEAMNLYLAGGNIGYKWAGDYDQVIMDNRPFVLESFYYCREHEDWIGKLKPYFKDLMIDSGAFTFMSDLSKGGDIDWIGYVKSYAEFILRHNIKHYLELDIDSVVGYKRVLELREMLEDMVGYPCIPVWHKSRGLDEYEKMCKNYSYIAIGGIVSKEIKKTEYGIFTPLLKMASKHKTKVHGLGFTNLTGIKKYRFYSVDSTAWLYGNRGGFLYKFNGRDLIKIQPDDKRLIGRPAAMHNFCEWLKFSKYAEIQL